MAGDGSAISRDIAHVAALPPVGRGPAVAWLNGRLARYHGIGPGGRPAWCPAAPWLRGWRGEPMPVSGEGAG